MLGGAAVRRPIGRGCRDCLADTDAEQRGDSRLVIVINDLHDADITGHGRDGRILALGTYRDTEVRQLEKLTKLTGI